MAAGGPYAALAADRPHLVTQYCPEPGFDCPFEDKGIQLRVELLQPGQLFRILGAYNIRLVKPRSVG